jgi:glycerol-3-phosphate cytidylyltransferase
MNRVLTFGVYDYFHLGHLRLFKQCKEYGDYLIVAVQDGDYIKKYKPGVNILYSTEERVEIIEALKVVDRVVVYQTVCTDFLETIDFEVLALGEDHVGERFDKIVEWCDMNEKKVVRLKRTKGISSTIVKDRVKSLK